jgi:hypothetical protein
LSVRSTNVGLGATTGVGVFDVFTVPDGFTLILKQIMIDLPTSAIFTVNFLHTSGLAVGLIRLVEQAGPTAFPIDLWEVFEAGDVLQVDDAGTSGASYSCSGALLAN